MDTTTKEFADWWSTCGFTCEKDEGRASSAFHAGMKAHNDECAQAFNEGYYKGVNEGEGLMSRDQFALTCPVTISEFDALRDQKVHPFANSQLGLFAAYCKFRYDYADGMLAARAKQPE